MSRRIDRLQIPGMLLLGLLALAIPSEGQQRGAGYRLAPSARATWFSFGQPTTPPTIIPIDQSALPWGPTGNGALDNTLYARRYAGGDPTLSHRGGMTQQGESGERAFRTSRVLQAACQAGTFGAGWDCAPTKMEIEDYSFTTRAGTGLYATHACLFTAAGCNAESPAGQCPAGTSCRPETQACPPPPTCGTCTATAHCDPCPTAPTCPPQTICPTFACAPQAVPASLDQARARLAAAVALSRAQPVNIGPALGGYIDRLLRYLAADHPCALASTGRLDVTLMPRAPLRTLDDSEAP